MLSLRTLSKVVLCAGLSCLLPQTAPAQIINQAIGGVRVDAEGVLHQLTPQEAGELALLRKQVLAGQQTADKAVALRKVSLRKLLETLEKTQPASADDVSPQILYLGGLTRIRYLFVDAEHQDIILAGPAEPIQITELGEVVGAVTGSPFVRLEDLVTALQTTEQAQKTGVTCSIEPTAEGLQRLEALGQPSARQNPELTAEQMKEAIGAQTIKLGGCDLTSHFAQVLAAADYRMKRLAMNLDHPAIRELPSFMQMAARGRLKHMMPRWWMADNYDALLRDPDGLAWELRGQGVKTLAEEDLFANGQRQGVQAAHPLAKKWADLMTQHFDKLATQEPIFGDLRNCMDLSVMAALIRRESLDKKASFDVQQFVAVAKVACRTYAVPQQVASEASLVEQARGGWLVSVSGGVDIDPYRVAGTQVESGELAALRTQQATPGAEADSTAWFWN